MSIYRTDQYDSDPDDELPPRHRVQCHDERCFWRLHLHDVLVDHGGCLFIVHTKKDGSFWTQGVSVPVPSLHGDPAPVAQVSPAGTTACTASCQCQGPVRK